MKRIALLASLAAACTFTACSKDDDPKSASEILTGRSWVVTSINEEISKGVAIDPYSSFDDCFKDNQLKFNAGRELVYDEGNTKCDPQDPQSMKGTWSLSNNDKTLEAKISMSDPNTGVSIELDFGGTIESIGQNRFVVTTVDNSSGDDHTIRTTFSAQ